jgi:predicted outer membrane protein
MSIRRLVLILAMSLGAGCQHKAETAAMRDYDHSTRNEEDNTARADEEDKTPRTAAQDNTDATTDANNDTTAMNDATNDRYGAANHGDASTHRVQRETLNDNQIVAVLAKVSQSEAHTAQSAVAKAKNPEVKRFAQTVLDDANKVYDQTQARIVGTPAASDTLRGLDATPSTNTYGANNTTYGGNNTTYGANNSTSGGMSGSSDNSSMASAKTGDRSTGTSGSYGSTGANGTTGTSGSPSPTPGAPGATSGTTTSPWGDTTEAATNWDPNMQAGANYDRAFMNKMVSDHERMLALLDMMTPQATATDLQAMVKDLRPKIQAHLDEARRIQSSLGTTSAVGMTGEPGGSGFESTENR